MSGVKSASSRVAISFPTLTHQQRDLESRPTHIMHPVFSVLDLNMFAFLEDGLFLQKNACTICKVVF